MSNPFSEDPIHLKDNELEEKIQDLSKKYMIAQRLGKTEMLTQIAMYVNIYREEMARRSRENLKTDLDGDLNQLINVN